MRIKGKEQRLETIGEKQKLKANDIFSSPSGDCVGIRRSPFDTLRTNGQVIDF
jgi:hypothetical protein